MQTAAEILKRIQEENRDRNNIYNNTDNSSVRSAADTLAAIKSGEVQQAVQNQAYTNENDLGTLTGAFTLVVQAT